MRSLLTRVRRALTPRHWRQAPLVFGSVVALVVGLGAGTAFAYFTSTGSGSGSGSTGTLQAVTVAAVTGTVNTPLLPGGTGDVILNVNNPNAFAVTLVSVTGNGSITADAGHSGCSPTGVTFTDQTGLNYNIPANVTTPVDLAGAASMSSSSLSACQGATFSIQVAITVHK